MSQKSNLEIGDYVVIAVDFVRTSILEYGVPYKIRVINDSGSNPFLIFENLDFGYPLKWFKKASPIELARNRIKND